MHDIEKIRAEIDQIHLELMTLFRRRLVLTQKIWVLKKSKNLPLIDVQRENEIIHKYDSLITDPAEKNAIQGILKNLLSETRNFLESKLK